MHGRPPRTDLSQVANVLAERRDAILARWLEAARAQPFHAGQLDLAVADHIPALFDGLVAVLRRIVPDWTHPPVLLDDPTVLRAAKDHARARFVEGLEPADVVTEFRLLRHEIGRALRVDLADAAPATDILGAELLVQDALDGAIGLALAALTRHVEEVRADFLATTVHDVQQPLSIIKGRAQLARRHLAGPAPRLASAIQDLRAIEDEADRLITQLNRLTDASRLALGGFELRHSQVDLVELARHAADRMPPTQSRRVRVQARQEPVVGDWDRDLIERVLDNLLSNAAKYSPPGTPIEVAVEDHAGIAQLTVRDEGIGLTSEDLDRVFERYGRSQAAVQRGIPGQGLGLYFARAVIVAHDGRMWIESPGPGLGVTVFVRLPRSPRREGTG